MKLSDIMWQTMREHIKIGLDNICEEYENNPKYRVLKIIEEKGIVGFGVYHDFEGVRYIHEVHYIGKNNYIALKFWKWFKRGAKVMRVIVAKSNKVMYEFCLKLGFKVIGEDKNNYILERGN